MIVCPNCNHQNPEGAIQCEACYTPLPAMTTCPNCGATVQTDATFCGQCGFNLRVAGVTSAAVVSPGTGSVGSVEGSIAATAIPDSPDPEVAKPAMEKPVVPRPAAIAENTPLPVASANPMPDVASAEVALEQPVGVPAIAATMPPIVENTTHLQQQTARLLHVQTNTTIEFPQGVAVIHIGKPNQRIPPDIDVSGFPNSEIVSRIHADIRLEQDTYYVEDVGSSNGTYINNLPLVVGDRHRLRPGDRIGLGKGDKVTFLFQLS